MPNMMTAMLPRPLGLPASASESVQFSGQQLRRNQSEANRNLRLSAGSGGANLWRT